METTRCTRKEMQKAYDIREMWIVKIEMKNDLSFDKNFIHQSNEECKLQFLHSRRRLYYL